MLFRPVSPALLRLLAADYLPVLFSLERVKYQKHLLGFCYFFSSLFYFLKDRDRLSGSGSTSQQSPWPHSAAQIAHLQRDTQICCAGSLLEVGMNIS